MAASSCASDNYALQPEPPDSPAETDEALRPDPNKPPVEGWKPHQFDRGWGAVLEGERVAQLPDSDQRIRQHIEQREQAWDRDGPSR